MTQQTLQTGTMRKLQFHGDSLNGRETEFGGQIADIENKVSVTFEYDEPVPPETVASVESVLSCPCGSTAELLTK